MLIKNKIRKKRKHSLNMSSSSSAQSQIRLSFKIICRQNLGSQLGDQFKSKDAEIQCNLLSR